MYRNQRLVLYAVITITLVLLSLYHPGVSIDSSSFFCMILLGLLILIWMKRKKSTRIDIGTILGLLSYLAWFSTGPLTESSNLTLGIARAEGEMTRLDIFSDSIMLLYGMDGDPNWDNRHTRFMGEVYAGDELQVEYSISNKVEGNSERYGILSIDLQIRRISDNKLVIVSRRNLYRMKK